MATGGANALRVWQNGKREGGIFSNKARVWQGAEGPWGVSNPRLLILQSVRANYYVQSGFKKRRCALLPRFSVFTVHCRQQHTWLNYSRTLNQAQQTDNRTQHSDHLQHYDMKHHVKC